MRKINNIEKAMAIGLSSAVLAGCTDPDENSSEFNRANDGYQDAVYELHQYCDHPRSPGHLREALEAIKEYSVDRREYGISSRSTVEEMQLLPETSTLRGGIVDCSVSVPEGHPENTLRVIEP